MSSLWPHRGKSAVIRRPKLHTVSPIFCGHGCETCSGFRDRAGANAKSRCEERVVLDPCRHSEGYSRTNIWDLIFHWPSVWCSYNLTVLPDSLVVSPPSFTNRAVNREVT